MRKRKKQKKSKEKFLEKPMENVLASKKEDSGENKLVEQIKNLCEGLYYISETDAEISSFTGGKANAVTKEEILTQTKISLDTPVEERNFDELFTRLTEIQDWFGDEERQTAQKFADLRDLLKNNLRDLKVFKIGKIELEVYVVGLDAESVLTGIKTKAVET